MDTAPCIHTSTMSNTQRHPFWSESVYARTGSIIPARFRKGNEAAKWSVSDVIAELLREPGHCHHVAEPSPPVHVYGIEPGQLRVREQQLYEAAAQNTKPYKRGGQVFQRGQRVDEPILLMAVASWPEPSMESTPERERWQRRVVRLARGRWGSKLRGVYAHTDETYYHLHLWVDDGGAPVKRLHAGHEAVLNLLDAHPEASRKEQGEAYKAGCSFVQGWFHQWVGRAFGWVRSMAPRPRFSRGAAARKRQEELEAREALAADELRKLKAERAAWEAEKAHQRAGIRDSLTKLMFISRQIYAEGHGAELEKRMEGLKVDPVSLRSLLR